MNYKKKTFLYYSLFIIGFFALFNFACNNKSKKAKQITSLSIKKTKDKIWAHRVNELDNIEVRINEFSGIEVDIFYNQLDGYFEVKHDLEEESIDLEFFLDSILKVKEVLFWFDYKNLNENTEEGISKLCSILIKRKLENVSFVESYYGAELEKFDGRIATSLWVPNAEIPLNSKDRNILYKEKYTHINKLDVSMLSANYQMFEFLSEYFPNYKCNYWMSGSLSKQKLSTLSTMIHSPKVNIILIDGNINIIE